jgi:parallel beta-helix repeat protein
MTSPSLVFVTLLTGLLASVTLPGQAQTAPLPAGSEAQSSPVANLPQPGYRLIHVSSTAGSDSTGDGSQMKPLRTIAQALQRAEAGTVIVLAPGEYSEATGETFPLQLRSGVTVQGLPGPNRSTAVIRGGGTHLSPSQGAVSAAILAVDRAGLGNVVVSNPATQGYGVWVEAGSPILRENTFAGNGRAGVHLAGSGQPVIQRNYFTQNGFAGLIVGGASQAQVQGNIFENTGTGIQIAAGAAPRIEENRIVQNQDGLILQANARPILANNEIARNRRNGLVEFQASAQEPMPDSIPFGQPLSGAREAPAQWGLLSAVAAPTPPTRVEAEPPRSQPIPAAAQPLSEPVPAAEPTPPEAPAAVARPPATPIEVAPPTPAPALVAAPPEPAPEAVVERPTPPRPQLPEPAPAATAPVPDQPAAIAANPPASTIPVLEPTVPAQPLVDLPPDLPMAAPAADQSVAAIATPPPTPAAEAAPPSEPAVSIPLTSDRPGAAAQEPAAGGAGNIAALRARVLAQRQAQLAGSAVGGADEADAGGVELAVIPAPEIPASNATAAAQPRGNIAALRERLLNNRSGAQAGAAESSEGVAITVTPPPVAAVAQPDPQNLAAVEPSLPLLPIQESLPASPRPEVPNLPTISGDLPLLQVPGPNIPVGNGGAMPEILASSGSGIGSGPPAPPSRASSLGLVYKVFIPAADEAAQSRVRAVVPDAFRVRVNGQVMMQAGAFADQATADAIANTLIQQGLDARVQNVP